MLCSMSEINVTSEESVRISGSFQNHFAHDSVRQGNNADHQMLPKCAPYHHEGYKTGKPRKNTTEIILLQLTIGALNFDEVP